MHPFGTGFGPGAARQRGARPGAYSNTNYTVRVGQPALLAAARAALKRSTPADAP